MKNSIFEASKLVLGPKHYLPFPGYEGRGSLDFSSLFLGLVQRPMAFPKESFKATF